MILFWKKTKDCPEYLKGMTFTHMLLGDKKYWVRASDGPKCIPANMGMHVLSKDLYERAAGLMKRARADASVQSIAKSS